VLKNDSEQGGALAVSEKSFVMGIQRSILRAHEDAFVWKTNDRFSLGMPDLLVVIEGRLYALEAKAIRWPMNIKKVLKHPFSGPQMSVIKQLSAAGAFAAGIVGVSKDSARLVLPDMFNRNGNFTKEEFDELPLVTKKRRLWRIIEWPHL